MSGNYCYEEKPKETSREHFCSEAILKSLRGKIDFYSNVPSQGRLSTIYGSKSPACYQDENGVQWHMSFENIVNTCQSLLISALAISLGPNSAVGIRNIRSVLYTIPSSENGWPMRRDFTVESDGYVTVGK